MLVVSLKCLLLVTFLFVLVPCVCFSVMEKPLLNFDDISSIESAFNAYRLIYPA